MVICRERLQRLQEGREVLVDTASIITFEQYLRPIGMQEMWFIDRPRGRVLRKEDDHYTEGEWREGEVECAVLSPLRLRVEWLLGDERPPVHEVLQRLQTQS